MNLPVGKLFYITVLSLAGGCQSTYLPEVHYDESFDFRQARTFAWMNSSPLSFHPLEAEVDNTLESSLMYHTANLLERAGLRLVDEVERADLAVSFSVGSRSKRRVERGKPKAIIGDDFERWQQQYLLGSGMEGVSYIAGKVCIELYSIDRQRPVWHGMLQDITLGAAADFGDSDLHNILGIILADYPPEEEWNS